MHLTCGHGWLTMRGFMAEKNSDVILSVRNVRKSFLMGDSAIQVLRGIDMEIRAGEFIAVEGRSGSGKSTLLHILGALDAADEGAIVYAGRDIVPMTSRQRSDLRTTEFGFVFQFYHLLPELNVMENTLLGPMIEHSFLGYRSKKAELRDRAAALLGELGLEHRLKHRPAHLSGGERQRVAIARALMNRPRILFADEPTGNLDTETGKQIMQVLERLHHEQKQTIVMVTHDRSIAHTADRVLVMTDGRITGTDANNHVRTDVP